MIFSYFSGAGQGLGRALMGFPRTLAVLCLFMSLGLVAEADSAFVTARLTALTPAASLHLEAEARQAAIEQRLPSLAELTSTLGSGLIPLARVEQHDGQANALYVLAEDSAGVQSLHWRAGKQWKRLASPPAVLAAAVQLVGQSHVLFLSDRSPGRIQIYAYHTITDTWAQFGDIAIDGKVETIVPAPNGFVVVIRDDAGNLSPGQISLVARQRGLTGLDYAVIIIYLAVVAGIGLYFYLRSKRNTADFFLAGRSIPWWAAGISLYATGTSAISFIAIPAKSYATNWLYLALNLIGTIGSVYAAYVIVPLIRRLNLMSVYEYLEMRFHPVVRSLASLICIAQHLIGRMSVVLLLPSLALSAVTGMNVVTCIVVMGVITTGYTVLGGMKAVIWTDVLQVFVMIGGALYAMSWMIRGSGGISQAINTAVADGKTHLLDWSFDFTIPNVWVFVLIAVFSTLTWPQDQVMVQRVLSTKDAKAAGRSMLTVAAMVLPGSFMFFAIGTLLYTYYKANPGTLNPLLTTDQTFPQFIATELPPGVTGLIIAGIFAASMATLSSNINSIATLISVDFYERFAKGATPRKSVRLAEWMTVAAGLVGTGVALLLSRYNVSSLFDLFIALMALLGGGFAGIYALGMFTRRANWQGAMIGIVASIVATAVVSRYTALHVLMYGPVSIAACIGFGFAGSWLFPSSGKSLSGLTIYDQLKPGAAAGPAKLREH